MRSIRSAPPPELVPITRRLERVTPCGSTTAAIPDSEVSAPARNALPAASCVQLRGADHADRDGAAVAVELGAGQQPFELGFGQLPDLLGPSGRDAEVRQDEAVDLEVEGGGSGPAAHVLVLWPLPNSASEGSLPILPYSCRAARTRWRMSMGAASDAARKAAFTAMLRMFPPEISQALNSW